MHIACPSCAAAYDVPDRLLAGPARSLRCSRCGTDFTLPGAQAVPATAAPLPEPEPPPPPTPPEPPQVAEPAPARAPLPRPEPLMPRELTPLPGTPPPALARAWVASIVVVAAAVAGFFVFHARVMEVWPASTWLFAALGLA